MANRNHPDKYLLFLWAALTCFLAVCVFFLVHHASWGLGDEVIVIHHTGMGKAFSPLGFEGMVTQYGRLYPFAYNLYNILLLFYDGYVPPTAVYALHAVALVIFAVSFAFLALHLVRSVASPWKYATVFFFVVICVFRVLTEFLSCYTGVWIVFLFLSLFLLFTCRFMDSGNWLEGVLALLSINYAIYCYETVFTIPMALGMCTLLFQGRKLTSGQKWFQGLLVGSGLLFLAVYAVVVLPRAQSFYQHYGTSSFLANLLKMFIANKLYWLSFVVLVVRAVMFLKRKAAYTFYDSLLLASFAYFAGAAVLKLNFTYYYNIGALVGLTASLSFLKDWLKPQWVCLVMLVFALFYGRKVPGVIRGSQAGRKEVSETMDYLSGQMDEGENLFWYEPVYEGTSPSYLDMRITSKVRIEVYLSWLQHRTVSIPGREEFDGEKGIWMVYEVNDPALPETPSALKDQDRVVSLGGIKGYQCP